MEIFCFLADRHTIKGGNIPPGNILELHTPPAYVLNSLLKDGGRIYQDMQTVEIASAECLGPTDIVLHDKAADVLVNAVLTDWRSAMKPNLHVYKKNTNIVAGSDSDSAPLSRGFHENYLVKRTLWNDLIGVNAPLSEKAKFWALFLLTRYLITGSGGIVCTSRGSQSDYVFTASPRFFAIGNIKGTSTTMCSARGLIEPRKEHHVGDLSLSARLHVIAGDANMMEKALWLTVGMSSLVLELLEDDAWDETLTSNFDWYLPEAGGTVKFLREVSLDLRGEKTILLQNGAQESIMDILWRYLELCEKNLARKSDRDEDHAILREWRRVLTFLGRDARDCVGILGWPTLKWIFDEYSGSGELLRLDDERMHLLNFQFHDLDFENSLYYDLLPDFERITTDKGIRHAAENPPETRAKLRVAVAKKVIACGREFSHEWSKIGFKKINDSPFLEGDETNEVFFENPYARTFAELDEGSRSVIKKLELLGGKNA